MYNLWEKYLAVERDIHVEQTIEEIEGSFFAFQTESFYEDGIFCRKFQDFENDEQLNYAYQLAVENATSSGNDPHIRWRARTFDFFLRSRLPGKCIEFGTAHGFMFYFALTKMWRSGFDIGKSEIILIDKFDTRVVDPVTGHPTDASNRLYASGVENVKNKFDPFGCVAVVQGWIPEVLANIDTTDTTFLHIDLNAAQPEIDGLRILFPNLLKGCVIILDDYGFFEFSESRRAHQNLAKELGYDILALPSGQGLIII